MMSGAKDPRCKSVVQILHVAPRTSGRSSKWDSVFGTNTCQVVRCRLDSSESEQGKRVVGAGLKFVILYVPRPKRGRAESPRGGPELASY